MYAKLLYAEDRACSNRGLNSCGFYIEGFRCDHGDFAWVTVMGNMNTLAVATLADAACIILAEGAALDETARKKAEQQDIMVLATEEPVFEAALWVWQQMQGEGHGA